MKRYTGITEMEGKRGCKPLVLKGARQVGKTWLMKEFGPSYYEHYAYFNFGVEDKSAPSFKRFIDRKAPEHAIRFSKRGYLKNGIITNMPLYLARKARELL